MNHVIKREYCAITVKLISPLSVSSGGEEYTDSDIMRNREGEAFVPGTSLMGAFRNYFYKKKDEESFMGYSKDGVGYMSSWFISDLYFDDAVKISVRDGVRLGENKIVEEGAKFDLEIIETGAEGTIYLETVIREKDAYTDFKKEIFQLINAIEAGDIRFGANKNRGFGRLKIENVYYTSFAEKQGKEWLEFLENQRHNLCVKKYLQKDWKDNIFSSKYISVKIPLNLQGGISIRRYSTEPKNADYEHITCNEVPVIPGSSWNGAIRADIKEMLKELVCQYPDKLLERWFGYVDKEKEEPAKQSRIVIGESRIAHSVKLPMTRNTINRFDASTIEGALYSEISYFGGNTILELKIQKGKDNSYQSLLGILLLVMKNIQNGYLPVGGQTAIGRGIFEASKVNDVVWSEKIDEEECMKALYKVI